MYTVYKHINKINGKVYVGQTVHSVERRWRKNGAGYRIGIFKLAIQKYGWDNFEHVIIETGLTKEEANKLEISLIKEYKNLGLSYNITDGGEGFLGFKMSEEAKTKISKIHKGKTLPEYMKIQTSLRFKGVPLSEKHKSKISAALIGKPKSEAAKRHMRKNHKLHNLVKIVKCDRENNVICVYESIAEASRDTGILQTHISRCARGKRPSAGGFIWKYYKENETVQI